MIILIFTCNLVEDRGSTAPLGSLSFLPGWECMDFLLSSSPPNILLLTTFLLFIISHFPIYGRAAGRESHIIADLKSDCAFHLGDYSFNLCPLAGTATAATKYSRDLIENGDIDLVEKPSSGTRLHEVAQGLSLPTSVSSISF
jgi:hypothetical protein